MKINLKKIAGKVVGGLKSAGTIAWQVVKTAAPVAAALSPAGKVRTVARAATAVIPLLNKVIKPLFGGNSMSDDQNKIEVGVRAFVEAIASMQGKVGLALIMHFAPVLLAVNGIYDAIAGKPKSEWVPLVRAALDNCVGNEPDALIGSSPTAMIKIDVPLLPDEEISDFLFGLLEKQLLKA